MFWIRLTQGIVIASAAFVWWAGCLAATHDGLSKTASLIAAGLFFIAVAYGTERIREEARQQALEEADEWCHQAYYEGYTAQQAELFRRRRHQAEAEQLHKQRAAAHERVLLDRSGFDDLI